MDPVTLTHAEIRDAVLQHGLDAAPSIQFGNQEWIFQSVDPRMNDGQFRSRESTQYKAIREMWYRLNADLGEKLADVAHDLYITGLMRHSAYALTSQQFELTEAGRNAAGTLPEIYSKSPTGLPTEVLEIWSEAVSCYPARLRAAALLLGVAAEMVINLLAERMGPTAPPNERRSLGKWQVSEKRRACVAILSSSDWRRANGIEDGLAKGSRDGLEMLGTLYSWARDEQAHARSVQPDRDLVYPMLNAFPGYFRAVMAAAPAN
jgi:hypothetical protein